MKKRLYRSKTDKKLCGVCAGVADYFGIDPTIVRVIWALLAFFYGTPIRLNQPKVIGQSVPAMSTTAK